MDPLSPSRLVPGAEPISEMLETVGYFELDDEEDEYYGASWVITLNFTSNYFAKRWAEENGYEGQVREGTGTTVIRIDEEE